MMRKQEKGMTLVELLAAITILAIVFVGFFSVFPQMTSMNFKTETKLETMNLARVELNDLKGSNGDLILKNYDDFKLAGECHNNNNPIRTVFTDNRIIDGTEYVYKVIHYEKDSLELDDKQKKIIANTPISDEIMELYLIHIQLIHKDEVISETFGFVPFRIVATGHCEME